jgi:TPR repeat protein
MLTFLTQVPAITNSNHLSHSLTPTPSFYATPLGVHPSGSLHFQSTSIPCLRILSSHALPRSHRRSAPFPQNVAFSLASTCNGQLRPSSSRFSLFLRVNVTPLKPAKNRINHIKPDKNHLAIFATRYPSKTNHINHFFREKLRESAPHTVVKRRVATPFGRGNYQAIVDRIALTIVFLMLVGCGRNETTQVTPDEVTPPAATNFASEIDSTNSTAEEELVAPAPVATSVPITTATQIVEATTTPAPAKPRPNYPAQEIYEQGLAELERGSENLDRQAVERALAFFRKAAEEGNAPAQHALGVSYLAGIGVPKDVEQGLVWLNKSAAQGYADAQFKLASLYIRGDVLPEDTAKALDLARLAAEQGHTEAQYNLGTIYATGKGVTKDAKVAAEWFRKAAEAGHPTAQSNLGVLYASGGVLEKNMEAAVQWWRKAAEQGQPSAQFNLAQALVEGKAVPKDLVEAYKWYHLAADRGDRDAARMRNALGVELSPEEVADALKRAREFKSRLQAQMKEKRELAF